MKKLIELKNYIRRHLAVSFTLLVMVAVLIIALIFQIYLKREYYTYLVEKSHETETAVLTSTQKNVIYSIAQYLNEGSRMAVDNHLFESVAEVTRTDTDTDTCIERYRLYNLLADYSYPGNVVAVTVLKEQGVVAQYDRYKSNTNESGVMWNCENHEIAEGLYKAVMTRLSNKQNPVYEVSIIPNRHPSHNDVYVFHIAYPLIGASSNMEHVNSVLVISYNMNIFAEFLDMIEIPRAKYVQGFISDENGSVLYAENREYIGKRKDIFETNDETSNITSALGYFGWELNIVFDHSEIKSHVGEIYNRGVTIYFILIIIYLALISWFMNRILRSIHTICEAVRKVEAGNYQSQIEIKGINEIWQLAKEYNKMTRTLEQKNREVAAEHKLRILSMERQFQAEREALESQINAHFICNTIGVINYEAIDAGNTQVSILLKKLSNILRYTFDQKHQEVYMKQEIIWLDQYLYLQKLRFETMFDYEIIFPEIYDHWPCCKLMFQPFVENSIIHGFEGKEEGGYIKIQAYPFNEFLCITIEDNGCGMDSNTEEIIQDILHLKGKILCKNREKIGIGILNVVTRMYMFYGEALRIEMETKRNEFTRFQFIIPLPEI